MAKTKPETIFEYEVDYEGAQAEAEKIARAIVRKHPELSYGIYTRFDEGIFLVLYGPDDEQVYRIANARRKRQVALIDEGKPIYFIYGGPKKP
jgi:hypothetical protein